MTEREPDSKNEISDPTIVAPRRSFIKATTAIAAGGLATGAPAFAETTQETAKAKAAEGAAPQPPKGFGVARVIKLTEQNLLVTEITAGLPEKFDVFVSIRPRKREGEGAAPGETVEGCVLQCGVDF